MKEKDLIFDRTKHVCYSKAVKKVIQNRLKEHFSENEAEKLWEVLICKKYPKKTDEHGYFYNEPDSD